MRLEKSHRRVSLITLSLTVALGIAMLPASALANGRGTVTPHVDTPDAVYPHVVTAPPASEPAPSPPVAAEPAPSLPADSPALASPPSASPPQAPGTESAAKPVGEICPGGPKCGYVLSAEREPYVHRLMCAGWKWLINLVEDHLNSKYTKDPTLVSGEDWLQLFSSIHAYERTCFNTVTQ